jgi:hypothetical protein
MVAKRRIVLSVLTDEFANHRGPPLGLEAVLAARDGDARCQTLHVPFPRSGKGLVEVVEVEQQLPLRRGERAEVGQMRIAAKLDPNAALWRTGEVRGHDVRRPAIEGNRRSGHAAAADRYELWHPLRGLLLEQGDGILPIGSWRPGGWLERGVCVR